MPRRMYVAILLLILTACPTLYEPYGPPPYPVIQKGARLKIESSHDESSHEFDVLGTYDEEARLTARLRTSYSEDGESKYDRMHFSLVKGRRFVLMLWGSELVPYVHLLGEARTSFHLFFVLDSVMTGDTLSLKGDNIASVFYFEKKDTLICHTGYSTELDGYLILDRLDDDTLSGFVYLKGKALGYYGSFASGDTISDSYNESMCDAEIAFRATKDLGQTDSLYIGSVLVNAFFDD